MDFLKDLVSTIKEILYDIFGYLIPGILVLIILSMPFIVEDCYSFMYSIYEIIFNEKIDIPAFINDNLIGLSWIYIAAIILISYLLGHLPIFLSSYLSPIGKFFLSKTKPEKDYSILCDNIIKSLKDDGLLKPVLFKKGNGKLNKDFIKTFASTNSRFSSHNDLIQKYIYKSNFYNSLSCIFFILFIDSLISSIVWIFYNPKFIFIINMIFIAVFLFICFLTFLCQYKRHENLKEKECYLFLYNYLSKKDGQ